MTGAPTTCGIARCRFRRRLATSPERRVLVLARCVRPLAGADYERAQRAARQGAELARRRGDAFGLLVAQFYRVWSSLLGGNWGEAEQVCDDSLRDARRNEHRQWQSLFQALRAWLLREACNPAEAVAVARDGLAEARATGFAFGELLAGLQFGLASLECRPLRRRARRARPPRRSPDPRAPAHGLALADAARISDWPSLALVDGRLDDARTRATRACETASRSGERNWHALGTMTLAEALSAAGRRRRLARRAGDGVRTGRRRPCAVRGAARLDASIPSRDGAGRSRRRQAFHRRTRARYRQAPSEPFARTAGSCGA